MLLVNTIKKLEKLGKKVYRAEFDHQPCWFCNGTALIDLKDYKPIDTTAKFSQVLEQIENNKSHICTYEGKKKVLTTYNKLGY